MYTTIVYDRAYVERLLRPLAAALDIKQAQNPTSDIITRDSNTTLMVYSMLSNYLLDYDQITPGNGVQIDHAIDRLLAIHCANETEELSLNDLRSPLVSAFEYIRQHFYTSLCGVQQFFNQHMEAIDDIYFVTHNGQGIMVVSSAPEEDVGIFHGPARTVLNEPWRGLMPSL